MKTIIITGASRGIGEFLFGKFSADGDKVYGTYHTENQVLKSDPHYFRLDITDYAGASAFAESLKAEIEHAVLINCAGNNYNSFAHKSEPEAWKAPAPRIQ